MENQKQSSPFPVDPQAAPLTSDEAIQRVGGNGRYQAFALVLTCLTFSTSSMISFGIPYLISLKEPRLECFYNDGSSGECSPDQACHSSDVTRYAYIHDRHRTLVNWVVEYELACWSKGDLSLVSTAYFAGFLLASVLFLPMADWVGRKCMTLAGLILQLVSHILIFVIPGSWYLFVFAAIIGIRSPMASHVTFMLLVETISPRLRPYFSLMVNGFDSFITCILAIVYEYLGSWKPWFVGVSVLILLLIIADFFYLPESPRFHMAQGNFQKARKSFAWIARINRRQMFHEPLEGQTQGFGRSSLDSNRTSSPTRPSRPNILDLWRGRTAREKCLLFTYPYFWFIADIVTYGISFSINDLQGSVYTFGMILGIAGIVTSVSTSIMADKLGRKGAFIMSWGMSCVGCILYQFLKQYELACYILIFLGKIGISGAFGLCFLTTSQYFPTAFRGVMFGLCNVFARVGGVISPQFSTVFVPGYFMLVFGFMSLSVFLLSFLLIETKNRKMPDVVEKGDILWDEKEEDPRDNSQPLVKDHN